LKETEQFNSFGVFPLGGKDASVCGIVTSFCKEDPIKLIKVHPFSFFFFGNGGASLPSSNSLQIFDLL